MTNLLRVLYYLALANRRLYWARDRLRGFQDKQLRLVVKHAYEYVPFYHSLYKEAGVRPSDIKGIEDLNKLPIVKKSDLKKIPAADLVSKGFSVCDLKRLTTGGSTGEPFSIYISEREDDWRKAIYMRANVSCGQKPRDRWVAVVDSDRSGDATSFQHLVRVYSQRVIPVTWNRFVQLRAIESLEPDILDGFSGVLWLLARESESRGMESIRPRMIFGSGDLIDPSSIAYLKKVFQAPYCDQFGCTEIDRSAWQCPERHSYHMDVDSVITQFVDSDMEVAPGEKGEVVYSSLFNYAMPLIRYNVQDIGVPMDEECTCGRKLPLMKVVEGRHNSFLVFPNGHVVAPISFIEALKAFRLVTEIEQYRVVQRRKDLIEIYIKKTREDVDEEKVRSWLLSNVKADLSRNENIDLSDVTFEVKFTDRIPLMGRGKLNVVVSYA